MFRTCYFCSWNSVFKGSETEFYVIRPVSQLLKHLVLAFYVLPPPLVVLLSIPLFLAASMFVKSSVAVIHFLTECLQFQLLFYKSFGVRY